MSLEPRSPVTQARLCPVPGCRRHLGTTKYGEPFAFCRRHYGQVPRTLQHRLWQAFRAWQRIEKQWLQRLFGIRPPALALARATAIQQYIDVREDCIRKITAGQEQLEIAQ